MTATQVRSALRKFMIAVRKASKARVVYMERYRNEESKTWKQRNKEAGEIFSSAVSKAEQELQDAIGLWPSKTTKRNLPQIRSSVLKKR